MDLILSIDQGGSKTAALVADSEGNILGTGLSGGACHSIHGMDSAMKSVIEAVGEAMVKADVSLKNVSMVVAGMTGADWPYEYPLLQSALHKTLGVDNTIVYNDCIIAQRAGTEHSYGAILCAGTGLNAAVQSQDGKQFIYGYYINPEDGGASGLGTTALREVFNAEVGMSEPTGLTEAILQYYHLPTVEQLLFQYVHRKLDNPKTLAPLLLAVAEAGDVVAQRIVQQFAERISRYVIFGLEMFRMEKMDIDLVTSGGLFKNSSTILWQSLERSLHKKAPNIKIVKARYEPVIGGLLIALDSLSDQRYSLFSRALSVSAEEHGLIRNTLVKKFI